MLGSCRSIESSPRGLLVDNKLLPALGDRLLRHAAQRGKGKPLFSVMQEQVALDLHAAGSRLRLPSMMSVVMCMLRHSGASTDFVLKHRSLAEIKLRGRWRRNQSLCRYEKGGRLAEQLNKLPEKLCVHVVRCAKLVNRVLRGSVSPLAGP